MHARFLRRVHRAGICGWGRRGSLGLALLLFLATAHCAVIGGYDFDGFHAGSPFASPDRDASTGDAAACIPRTCSALKAECGQVPDGCDDILDCGECSTGVCGGGGRNKCGQDVCLTRNCADLGASCGEISDGCAGTVQCGRCAPPETCGGGGMSKKCGCTPFTCPELGADCGVVSDGCDKEIDCGSCHDPGETCGGAGTPHRCGCKRATCEESTANCGLLPDHCGGMIDCGACASGMTCGGDGPNRCGTKPCVAKTCASAGA